MQRKIYLEIIRHLKRGNFKWLIRNSLNLIKVFLGAHMNYPLSAPLLCGVLVTYRCNLSCAFCNYPNRGDKTKELSTSDFQDIIREFHNLGTPAIGFAGGDPILRKDIWTLVRTAVDLGMTTSLGSNGTMWTDDTIEQLFDSGLHLVGFSLESTDSALHDKLQEKNGAWVKVCETIRKVNEFRKRYNKKIVISVSTNFNFQNLAHITAMPAFAKSLGADQVNYIGMETGGIEKKENQIKDMLDIKNRDIILIDKIVDELKQIKKKSGLIDNSYDSLEAIKYQARGLPLPVRCLTGYTSLYVDCYGQFFSCMAFMEDGEKTAGIYQKGKLRDFWYSKMYGNYRKKYLNNCHACYWPCQNEMNYLFNIKRI